MPTRTAFTSKKTKFSEITVSQRFLDLIRKFVYDDNCVISQLLLKSFIWDRYASPLKKYNFIDFREKKGMISFQPFDKEQKINSDGKWSRDGRQEIKPAKFVKLLLNPRLIKKFKDHEIATFATRLKAYEASQEVDIVRAPSINEAYTFSNYDVDFESCMSDKDVSSFYMNFDVEVLVAKRKVGGKLAGRALLWPRVNIDTGSSVYENQPFMDRIYSCSPEITELFIQYAKNNGIWYKEDQSCHSLKKVVNPNGEIFTSTMIVASNGDIDDELFFPYLDTFCYSEDDYSLINVGDGFSKYCYRETDGTRSYGETEWVLTHNGERVLPSEAIYRNEQWYENGDDLVVYVLMPDGQYGYELRENSIKLKDDSLVHKDCVNTPLLGLDYKGDLYQSQHLIKMEDGQFHHMHSPEIKFSYNTMRYHLRNRYPDSGYYNQW
jgi:hypothetical protein